MTDLVTRAADIARRAREQAPAKRERNRDECPGIAAWWDEWTAVFGRPQYMRMTEGGRVIEMGKPSA